MRNITIQEWQSIQGWHQAISEMAIGTHFTFDHETKICSETGTRDPVMIKPMEVFRLVKINKTTFNAIRLRDSKRVTVNIRVGWSGWKRYAYPVPETILVELK